MDFLTDTLIGFGVGWGLDALLGDPTYIPHPVVMMGHWIAKCEKLLNRGGHCKIKGGIFAIGSIMTAFAIGLIATRLTRSLPHPIDDVALTAVTAAVVFYCLAGKTLRQEVQMVFDAADKSLQAGRQQVSRIVGRDTQNLTANEVRTAALETLAENLSDGVLAPVFWFAILGVPGMLTYKMVNTMDSMIGYVTPRYKEYGCIAAHADDVMNYIPARLTALLIVIAGCAATNKSLPQCIKFIIQNGNKHKSPNSGWPESAMAGVLDCQFGGTHNYFGQAVVKPHIGDNAREITKTDGVEAIRISLYAEVVGNVLTMCIMGGMAYA